MDWGDALDVPTFYDRESEATTLAQWVVQERCRVVSVLGLGGIGKSALVTRVMHQVAAHFEVVLWRSLRDAPECEALLEDCLQVLAPQPLGDIPAGLDGHMSVLLNYLREARALLVLDNVETLLEEGVGTGRMREGYEGYARLLRRVAETEHQSCVLLTSREKPRELVPLSDSDFRWVWLARIVLVFGYGTSAALSFYMLQSYITPALSAPQATRTVPLLSIVGLPATLVALVISGRLSDKLGRRKPFVIVASLLMAVSMAVPLLWPTLIALFIQTFLAALAFGIYLPVDQALFIDVLPDKNAAGRELGIANVASNIGLAIAPILAAQVVALTSGYRMVWVVALVLLLVAAVVIVPVKRAR